MNIALLGYGVVGAGVYELIQPRTDLNILYILDRRPLLELGSMVVRDMEPILRDERVDTVIEVLGGLHPSYEFVTAALRAGKNVVTANKYLVCHYLEELTRLARQNGVALRYTAAAGGGIPWLVNLERARRVDSLHAISGILNGTTNYILDTMLHSNCTFSDCLAQAQRLGYAEADPSADIDGHDVRRKLILSAKLAFDCLLTEPQIPTCGIRTVRREDMDEFRRRGLVCKLMAHGHRTAGGVSAYVEPTLLPLSAPESAVPSNFNFITLEGKAVGRLSFYGQGAGRYPTACNCVQDCLDILEDTTPAPWDAAPVQLADEAHAYYVRTDAPDPWLAAHTADRFGCGIKTTPVSVKTMHQWLGEALARDPACFLAGFEEGTEC